MNSLLSFINTYFFWPQNEGLYMLNHDVSPSTIVRTPHTARSVKLSTTWLEQLLRAGRTFEAYGSFFSLGNKSKGRRAKPGVLYFFLLLPPQGCLSLPPRATKQRQKSEAWGAEVFLSPLPPQGCRAPHLIFFLFLHGERKQRTSEAWVM